MLGGRLAGSVWRDKGELVWLTPAAALGGVTLQASMQKLYYIEVRGKLKGSVFQISHKGWEGPNSGKGFSKLAKGLWAFLDLV